MKVIWKEICTAFFMGAILPVLILNISALLLRGKAQELPIVESVPETSAAERLDFPVLIHFSDGNVKQMDMDMYLTGVVLGEMPADFESEALKAQAVAARTYTAKAVKTGGKHGDGSICTDPSCCQAYLSEEMYLSRGGTEELIQKVTVRLPIPPAMC